MITIVTAMGLNHSIGLNGDLPWPNFKEDKRLFYHLTKGKTLLMGSKTYQTLPISVQRDTDRNIIVLTREPDAPIWPNTITTTDDISAVISDYESILNDHGDELMVIGGADVYEQCLKWADKLQISHIHKYYRADTFFPAIDWREWANCGQCLDGYSEALETPYSFNEYRRVKP